MRLSVLDLIPIRPGQNTRDGLVASAALAREADLLGYTRYWVAEHHNAGTVGATVPGVIIPFLAAGTTRIRFGSGGVMLPNHAAFAIAEQFALLEAMFPGRIDLGIGRAPGTDQVTSYVLRGSERASSVDTFEQDVLLAQALLGGGSDPSESVTVSVGGRPFELRATPRAVSSPTLWLLGSSMYSAQLSARLGLPYVFANHFSMAGVEEGLARYRGGFVPSDACEQPTTILPVNVVVAETEEQAELLAGPGLVHSVQLRTGTPPRSSLTVEQAQSYELTVAERAAYDQIRARWYIGTPERVSHDLRQAADGLDIDEIMVVPNTGVSEGDPGSADAARIEVLRLLANELL